LNFEEIWQENKDFILKLAGGGMVFLIGWLFVTSGFQEEIKANERSKRDAEATVRRMKLPANSMSEAKGKFEQLEEQYQSVEKELFYRPDPGFTLRGISGPTDVFYNEAVQKLSGELVEGASTLDIRIDAELGLDGVTPRTDEEREWYLNALDVVRRFCLAGVAGGVESIEPIKIAPMPKKKRGEEEEGVVRPLTVDFVAVGAPTAIDGLLRALQQPGRRLAVERATITSLDGDRKASIRFGGEGLVRLNLKVKALLPVSGEGEGEES
jgi:hypothetical protein